MCDVLIYLLTSLIITCRGVYPPAYEYLNHADKSQMTLVEAFRNMQIEEPLENGDYDHEV